MSSNEPQIPEGVAPRRVPTVRPGPVGGKRDQNRRDRTRALMSAALKLFLDRGVDSVTVDEIAREAGMAKGSFYRYVKDKRDLVEGLIEPLQIALLTGLDDCARDIDSAPSVPQLTKAYTTLAFRLLAAYREHQNIVQLYLQESRAPASEDRLPILELEEGVRRRTLQLTVVAHEHGLLSKILPEVSALAVVGAVERILLAHLRGLTEHDETTIVVDLVRMVMEGISS